MKDYLASDSRYDVMQYNRCGHSGVLLPKVSLGMWHNFGGVNDYQRSRTILRHAFDCGITHLDLANNYGPPYGSAEETLGHVMDDDLHPYRDELFISTKAGYDMWPGPYGNWGSRKYLMASLDQSLRRMHLDYVDLFYSHRYDPNTPLEETLQALVDIVRCGKALYVGISRWPLEATRFAIDYLKQHDVPLLIYQGEWDSSPSHHWLRASSPTAISTAFPMILAWHRASFCARTCSLRNCSNNCANGTRRHRPRGTHWQSLPCAGFSTNRVSPQSS